VKFVDEFRDGKLARAAAAAIRREASPERVYRLMEFCGGHTHAIFRYGLEDLLPDHVEMVHGPGCPVCVLPIGRVDQAIRLALDHNVILCTYGDMLRVPGAKRMTLMKARAEGADVRMVYSATDALRIAREYPDREVVFFAIGFETTTPPTAVILKQAQAAKLENFFVFCNHVLTPSALIALLDDPQVRPEDAPRLDGFVGPSHVSTVIGSQAFEFCPERYQRPVVIAGFEPLDVLQSILMLVRQLNEDRCEVENQYRRVVTREGNPIALALMDEVFELRETFEWRGLGMVPRSALRLRGTYAAFDAERRYGIEQQAIPDNKGCECPSILRGLLRPTDCKLFAKACTPDNPLGSCMVSSEGACAAYYSYGRFRNQPVGAP